jgi:hypothetical protein
MCYSRVLAKEVRSNMTASEVANRHSHRPSICGLYLHFFVSIFAVLECLIRLLVHVLILLVLGLTYYLVYCLTCGRSTAEFMLCIAHHSAMYGIYSGLLCGLMANIGRSLLFGSFYV